MFNKDKIQNLESRIEYLEGKIKDLEYETVLTPDEYRKYGFMSFAPKISIKTAMYKLLDHLNLELHHNRESFSLSKKDEEK